MLLQTCAAGASTIFGVPTTTNSRPATRLSMEQPAVHRVVCEAGFNSVGSSRALMQADVAMIGLQMLLHGPGCQKKGPASLCVCCFSLLQAARC